MAKNTIKILKRFDVVYEYDAVAGITPGHLVEFTSAGKVQVHSSAGGNAAKMVALEDELQGKTISDAYVAADKVQVWHLLPGEEFYGLLKNGESVAVGDLLESAGDGTLQKYVADAVASSAATATIYPLQIVGMALEAVDMSGSSGVDPSGRIEVRVI